MSAKKQPSINQFFSSQRSKSSENEESPRSSPSKQSYSKGIEKFQFVKQQTAIDSPKKLMVEDDAPASGSSTPNTSPLPTGFASSNLLDSFQYDKNSSSVPPRTKRHAPHPITNNSKPKKPRTTKLTPLENQILELTELHQDKILLIQVGYKYKAFGEDAKHVSKCLNIMYVPSSDARFAYCSFPDTRLHINLQRILNSGVKVGIVKQMETAIVREIDKAGKSGDLMRREVTGVYTKGTYMSDEFVGSNLIPNTVEEEHNSYIVCINEVSDREFAVIAVQPLTGEIIYDVFVDDVSREEMETRLLYLRPSEVIVINGEESINPTTMKCLKLVNHELKIEHRRTGHVQFGDHLNLDMADYYVENFPLSVQQCFYELIVYLAEFKLSNVFTISQNITTFKDARKYMILPASTLSALEIFTNSTDPKSPRGTLVWLLNHTRTRFGSRLLHKWISRPLIDRERIEERYAAVQELGSEFNHVVDSLMKQLEKIGKSLDMEELLIKIHYSATTQSTRINRKQIFVLLHSFNDVLTLVKSFAKTIRSSSLNLTSSLIVQMLNNLLESAELGIVENFITMMNPSYLFNESKDPFEQKSGFFNLNHGYDDINHEFAEIKNVEQLLDKELVKVRKLLQRPQLNYVTCNREPYLIEVRNGKAVDALPSNFIKINGTATVSRFRNKEISNLYKLKQYHEEILIQRCDEAFVEFLQNLDSQYGFFQKVVKHLATLDCLLSITAASVLNNQVRPTLTDDLVIDVKQARHPIVEQLRDGYVGNDINIQYDTNRALIITGPNMGGKSSYVKMAALFTIMTQIGCYLPCESATMGIFDSVFIRMGASDNILKGNSTFMTEMLECSNIIQRLTTRSLVILDEIGRGTGTTDGIALAYAILRYFIESESKPLLLFITHYPSIHVLEHEYPGEVVNYHMGFEEIGKEKGQFPEVIFSYNLCRGVVNNSYGLNVAKLAGIPEAVIANAYQVSEELKTEIELDDAINLLKMAHSVVEGNTQLSNLFKYIK
ncbi:MSH3 [Candida theae]|uniref:DNA mismatch repair protein MSH3 n=1 Tax=Candida theae TaxID=1198502 RepID=A0AAD5FX65_9ASCO|nr:MSH3 [Candida theae]KAI5952106.1 MSH3 [Candida theae]